MKKVFVVMAHQLPDQLNVFISQLLSLPDSEVFVHVNKRNDEIKKQLIADKRVHVSDNNIPVVWASDSFITAILNTMREVRASKIDYDYLFLCSGQDLLVKNGIDEFLEAHKGEYFIDGYEEDKKRRAFLLYKWPSKYIRLIDNKLNPTKIMRRLRIELFKRGFPFFKKKVEYNTKDIVFYRNWFWSAMPKDIADYMLQFLDENPGFGSIYKDSLAADEGIFLTLIMNSPFKNRVKFNGNGRSHSLHYDGKRSNGHSTVITSDEINDIESENCFFARKFDSRIDKDVIRYFAKKLNVNCPF